MVCLAWLTVCLTTQTGFRFAMQSIELYHPRVPPGHGMTGYAHPVIPSSGTGPACVSGVSRCAVSGVRLPSSGVCPDERRRTGVRASVPVCVRPFPVSVSGVCLRCVSPVCVSRACGDATCGYAEMHLDDAHGAHTGRFPV